MTEMDIVDVERRRLNCSVSYADYVTDIRRRATTGLC